MKFIYLLRFYLVLAGVLIGASAACRSISFDKVDLQPIMLQQGDLPLVLVARASRSLGKDDYFNYDVARVTTISTLSGSDVGAVGVYLFHTYEDRDKQLDSLAHMEIPEGIVAFETPAIGEVTVAQQGTLQSGALQIDLTFKRCYAVANIQMRSVDEFTLQGDEIVAFAQKLDARLQSVACP